MQLETHRSANIHPLYANAGLLDRQEAAKQLGVSIRKLDHLVSRGDIKPTRIDRRVLVSRDEIHRYRCERQGKKPLTCGERIRLAREYYGISVDAIAAEMGTDMGSIERIESGAQVTQMEYAFIMAVLVYMGESAAVAV